MTTATLTMFYNNTMDLTEQLNQFFITNEKKAYAIALMSLKNQDDALDVVQDVMIKFVEKYKTKNQKDWQSLFYRMIQNKITDFHRQASKKKSLFRYFTKDENDDFENIADDKQVAVLRQIDNEVEIKCLQKALDTLPTRQLQAFMCRIWEGLSVAQTAASMKCSQGSVKTHLFRALKKLKAKLEESKNG